MQTASLQLAPENVPFILRYFVLSFWFETFYSITYSHYKCRGHGKRVLCWKWAWNSFSGDIWFLFWAWNPSHWGLNTHYRCRVPFFRGSILKMIVQCRNSNVNTNTEILYISISNYNFFMRWLSNPSLQFGRIPEWYCRSICKNNCKLLWMDKRNLSSVVFSIDMEGLKQCRYKYFHIPRIWSSLKLVQNVHWIEQTAKGK